MTVRGIFSPWAELFRSYKQVGNFRWLVLGITMGILSGLLAVAFFAAVEFGKFMFLHKLAGLSLPAPAGEEVFHSPAGQLRPWVIPLGLTITGLITGWLVNKFIPESTAGGTDGTDATIKCFHQGGGIFRPLIPIIKGLSSIFTIACGGSAGREGPITQMGAGIGSYIAQKTGMTAKERRIMLLAGAAGGLGAIFRAPLGGAMTAIEVIYREDFESEAVLPSILSSVVAYSLFTFFYGTDPIFGIPHFHFRDPRELIFYTVLAFACAFTGWLYVGTFKFIKFSIFARINNKVGLMWATAFGGLCMGLFGMFYPEVLAGGYGWVEMAIMGQLPIMMMLTILIGKTVATSVTIGSGMSGGMFAPALFVGGMTGGIVGQVAGKFYPHIVTQPGGYVLVGMAAFFAGVAKAPVGPLIMVCELTQGYGLLAPLMLASAICIVLGKKFFLYEHQVDNKFESPAHIEDSTINLLEQMRVEEHYTPGRVTTLEEGTTLKALTDIIANTNELYFPVKNDEGHISGILSIHNVRNVLFNQDLFDLILTKDLATKPAILYLGDDLYTALLKFVDTDYGQIPVVAAEDQDKIIGIINREDVFRAYANAIREIREQV